MFGARKLEEWIVGRLGVTSAEAPQQGSAAGCPHEPVRNLKSAVYSHLNATIGSTFAARRAGIQQATSATTVSKSAITTNVSGSVALTPNSKPDIRRVSATAAAEPIVTPIKARLIPCLMTSLSTLPARAPSAIRTPISRVRSETV